MAVQRLLKMNKHQSHLVKDGIAPRLYSTAGSIGVATASFDWEFDLKFTLPQGVRYPPPFNTMCHWTAQVYLQMASKSVERFKQGSRM